MGTNYEYERTLPVRPSDRRELKQELEWMVFKKEKNRTSNEPTTTNR